MIEAGIMKYGDAFKHSMKKADGIEQSRYERIIGISDVVFDK
jgi:hypothetical protein